MNIIVLEVAVIAALLLLNATFSMSEMAVVSARKTRLLQLASKGSKGAGEALRLAESPSRFLSTVQIGITLVGVLSGAFGGATISEEIAFYIAEATSFSVEVSEGIGVAIIVTIITFLSVIFGELIPKRLALKYPEEIASLTAGPMNTLSRMSAPVVWIFSSTTDLVLRIFHLDKSSGSAGVTHEEIKAMVEQGEQEGIIGEQEGMMMDRVLTFGKRRVTSIMTHVRDIVWIDSKKPIGKQLERLLASNYSVYPVADGGLDHLMGTVNSKDICKCVVEQNSDLSSLLFQPLFIPETSNALQTLDLFQKTGLQVGFVIDEFGSIQGLVTMTNIIEAIVGALPVDGIPEKSPIVKRDDDSWLVDGALPIALLKEHLGIGKIEGEEENLFHTLAGFVMYRLGRVPSEADVFYWKRWRFEVVDMDNNRIEKIIIAVKDKD
jgi:putative hemolysin